MDLEPIWEDEWYVYAAQGHDALFADVPSDVRSQFLALIMHVASAEKGPACLGSNRNHPIADDPHIWQLSIANNKFRAPYFYMPGKIIVVTHIFRKRKNDTPKPEIDRALAIRKACLTT